MGNVEIRQSELAKVPLYTEELRATICGTNEVGLEQALTKWAERITQRRLTWFEQHKDEVLPKLKGSGIRRGFQLVLFEYMGLNPDEILIIEETETKIT